MQTLPANRMIIAQSTTFAISLTNRTPQLLQFQFLIVFFFMFFVLWNNERGSNSEALCLLSDVWFQHSSRLSCHRFHEICFQNIQEFFCWRNGELIRKAFRENSTLQNALRVSASMVKSFLVVLYVSIVKAAATSAEPTLQVEYPLHHENELDSFLSSSNRENRIFLSTYSTKGRRKKMEDFYVSSDDCCFAGTITVSRFLPRWRAQHQTIWVFLNICCIIW